jgi:ABC-2 type transport system permease protein
MFTLVVIAAIWGMLAATKVTRGEEDAGRWELVLAGRTTQGRALVQAACGLGAGVVALWAPTAVLAVASGATNEVSLDAADSLLFATAIAAAAAMFMAVGLLAGQLCAARHDANLLAAAVLGASYLVRMAGDSDPALAWLRWLSPLGWLEQMAPLTDPDPLPLVLVVALVSTLVAGSYAVARRRDLGASAFPSRDTAAPHVRLLGGQAALTLRLTRTTILCWLAGLALTGVVFGLVAQAAGNALQGSPGVEHAIERLGGTATGAVAYLGLVFLIAAGIVAIAMAGQVTAMRGEEASGRLENLLVRPVARRSWLGVRVAVAASLAVCGSVLTGLAGWVGTTTQGADVGFWTLLEAGLNIAAPSLFVLGVGALAFGLRPRWAAPVTYGIVVWSLLAETISSLSDSLGWIEKTSPLLAVTPAPAADPDWTSVAWLVALAGVAVTAALAAFARRDLEGA